MEQVEEDKWVGLAYDQPNLTIKKWSLKKMWMDDVHVSIDDWQLLKYLGRWYDTIIIYL